MNTQKGIVMTIVILVIALLILSYYGFDLRKTVESPTTQSNFSYVSTFVMHVWDTYLKGPVMYLWNEVFLKYIWANALDIMQHGSKGVMQNMGPSGGSTGSSIVPLVPPTAN